MEKEEHDKENGRDYQHNEAPTKNIRNPFSKGNGKFSGAIYHLSSVSKFSLRGVFFPSQNHIEVLIISSLRHNTEGDPSRDM